jgi:prephenate dehydratase
MKTMTNHQQKTEQTQRSSPAIERIAFQGLPGAHADMACRRAHPYMETVAYPTFDEVFQAVHRGEVEYGMVPIENSQAGRVAEIHTILPTAQVHFVGESFQPIRHALLAPKGAKLADIKTVYSHPQALIQCKDNLTRLGLKDRHEYSNTAQAASDVAAWGDKSKAAIASPLAAELYGLEIIEPALEDSPDNTTLFICIAKEAADPDPEDGPVLTTLLFTVRNIPAALYKAMGGFATNNINILKLESYISLTSRDAAQFYLTFEGHPRDRAVQRALEELGFFCHRVDVLGVYHADPHRFR